MIGLLSPREHLLRRQLLRALLLVAEMVQEELSFLIL